MIKKLFLFTLLVSSFLVISCSNKDTTGPTVTGVDSKWYGTYKYSGKTETGVSVESIITVSENGILIYEIENGGEPISGDYPNSQLKKVSENVYQSEELPGPTYVKFEFASIATGATLTMTTYVDGQASAPVVYTKTSTVIDSKWYGTYDGTATDAEKKELNITIDVNADGITLTKTYTGQNSEIIPISNDFITMVSDSQYEVTNGEVTIEFTFNENSVTYHETIGGISMINQNIPETVQQ